MGGERLDDAELWHEYVDRKQTYREIGEAHGVSAKTVQRRLMRYHSERPRKEPRGVIVLMDTTYWGRAYGVMLFKDAITNENLLKYFVTSETVERYVQGIAELERMGYDILGIVCDGRRGLFNAFPGIPLQMCQFHQQRIVTARLTKRPKTEPGRELRSLSLMLTKTDRESFVGALRLWHEKWVKYLNERTTDEHTGKSHYTHKPLRSAYLSLVRNLPYLFTYLDHMDIGMPNTTNAIDGHFSELKTKLRVHNGLSRKQKRKFVTEFLEA